MDFDSQAQIERVFLCKPETAIFCKPGCSVMRFSKPALTPQQQLNRLINRGLEIHNRERALRLLEVTSFFRLIPYMRPFQQLDAAGKCFRPGVGLKQIYTLYQFDSRLRQHTM
ncbi:MAG: Abi family protein [Gammaproteobacteria bacterium]|nr:Abi family protein [Gammaproteobacteria bacterium]